jgi:hypothetical protein
MTPTETTHTDQPTAAALAAMAGHTRAEEAAYENERRADSAEAALMAHALHRDGAEVNIYNLGQTEEQLTDLFTNLRHFCAANKLQFDYCFSQSQWNFWAEVEEAQA